MVFAELLIALLVAFLVAALFTYPLARPGPWGGFFWFFLILFLGTWAVSAWVEPVGPVVWGVAWAPIAVAAVLIGLLIAAVPPHPRSDVATPPTTESDAEAEAEAVAVLGAFFWLLVVGLVLLVLLPWAVA